MNRLFVLTLATILGALLILVTLLGVLTLFGLQRSIAEWDSTRSGQLRALATQILRQRPTQIEVPDNAPLFVYDAAGTLVFSNRGQGARLQSSQVATPIRLDGQLLGYYRAGDLSFQSDAANNRFLESLRRSLWLGLLLSLVIAFTVALVFSRNLSTPAVRVARALDRIAHGELSDPVRPGGAREISEIGDSANRLRLQLQREQDLRRQWVHDVAHDLRTPVAALSAQFEAMRDGVLDISEERLDKVLRELDRVRGLVADLEELMRLESPEMRVSIERLDPAALVAVARERVEHLLRAKNIRFQSHIETTAVLADGSLIQRALSNFLANAVRHCPDGGSVSVDVQRRRGMVAVRVTNTGDPIPAEDLDRVFDRLFRGEYARHSSGSGLGLTIARRIAELHRGEVRIANSPDGVVVELLLPQSVEAQGVKAG